MQILTYFHIESNQERNNERQTLWKESVALGTKGVHLSVEVETS